MGQEFLVRLLVQFLKDNIIPLKQQFYEWLKAQAANSETEIDDEFVKLVAALLGLPE